MEKKILFTIRNTFKKKLQSLLTTTPYWTSSVYGFGKWIRKYGFYPNFLPLCIYTDHAPGHDHRHPFQHELESDAPVQFYHSIDSVKQWRDKTSKPCYCLYSPFVFARKKLMISRTEKALGTVYFLSHSTPDLEMIITAQEHHEILQKMPEKYKPVKICLHYHDMTKGLDKDFISLGYDVVTVGAPWNVDFIENFYKILSETKYAISNTLGGAAYYSIELGVPYGIIGKEPNYINVNDKNIESGEYNSYLNLESYNTLKNLLFGLPKDEISNNQYNIVREGLGLDSGIGRLKMSFILYTSLIKWLYIKTFCKSIVKTT
jgi:hypothetical protein